MMMNNIYAKHLHWIKQVEKFGEFAYAEDIVQEAYIKVHGKEINEAYFYFTLRSLTMDLHRKKVIKLELTDQVLNIPENIEVVNDVSLYFDYIDTWDWYDKKMFLTYINNKMSMRQLSKELGITFSSVYNTITNCKNKLKQWQKENHQED
jgi:DNA-directed RNA polymerase specialized sigma24 family protein